MSLEAWVTSARVSIALSGCIPLVKATWNQCSVAFKSFRLAAAFIRMLKVLMFLGHRRSCHPNMASKFCVNWMFHHIHCGKVLPVECFITCWLLKDPFLLVGKAFPAKLFVQEPLFFCSKFTLILSIFKRNQHQNPLHCLKTHSLLLKPYPPFFGRLKSEHLHEMIYTLLAKFLFVWTMMIHPNSEASKYAFLRCLGNHDHSRQNVYRVKGC